MTSLLAVLWTCQSRFFFRRLVCPCCTSRNPVSTADRMSFIWKLHWVFGYTGWHNKLFRFSEQETSPWLHFASRALGCCRTGLVIRGCHRVVFSVTCPASIRSYKEISSPPADFDHQHHPKCGQARHVRLHKKKNNPCKSSSQDTNSLVLAFVLHPSSCRVWFNCDFWSLLKRCLRFSPSVDVWGKCQNKIWGGFDTEGRVWKVHVLRPTQLYSWNSLDQRYPKSPVFELSYFGVLDPVSTRRHVFAPRLPPERGKSTSQCSACCSCKECSPFQLHTQGRSVGVCVCVWGGGGPALFPWGGAHGRRGRTFPSCESPNSQYIT